MSRGFTLLEMLVALAVFAVIGIISAQLLTQMISFTENAQSRGERLVDLHRSMEIMRRDFEQLTYRTVRDELGEPGYDVSMGIGNLVEFSRKGWLNPNLRHRSEVQRVAYDLRGDRIYRMYWPVLDRSPDTIPVEQVIVKGVIQANVIAIDQSGEELLFWPPTDITEEDIPPGLAAIKFEIETKDFGPMVYIWVVPDGTNNLQDRPGRETDDTNRVTDLNEKKNTNGVAQGARS